MGRAMTDARPRLLLPTPPRMDPEGIAARLPAALATGTVNCVRLDRPGAPEDEVRRAADLLRPICHAADTALVILEHYRLVRPLGLDGVQVAARGPGLRKVREEIGRDAVLGAGCGASRHEGISAAEAGADYVLFGPLRADALGAGDVAVPELFEWWAELIETPVVAEGGLDLALAHELGPYADFAAPDATVWEADDLPAALRALAEALETDDPDAGPDTEDDA